jgi:hypothetical protein
MTVEAIKTAIEQLAEAERRELADWFGQLEDRAWDDEMEQDFSSGGRGLHLVEKINQEVEEGKFSSLQKGMRSPQGRR